MASLTHVCMWSGNGWKQITAEQAARLHPGGSVSAHSGLFMCELCGQYVSLTDGSVQTRHFRHSAHEKSKNCPERIFGAGYSVSYSSQKHDLPIRITGVSSSSLRFEIGLIRAPIGSFSRDFRIEIKPKGTFGVSYVFTKERLNGLSFYRNAFAGPPSKLYHLKSSFEIVKNIVLSSISWTTYKTRAVTRAEYRAFKDFLGAIPVDNITCKIETACRCSNSTAKELLDEFLNVVWKYVDGDSLDDEIILSAISASTELQERTKALIRADWEAENKSLLAEAQKKLDSLDAQLKSATPNRMLSKRSLTTFEATMHPKKALFELE